MDNLANNDWNDAFSLTFNKKLTDWYSSDLIPYLLKILSEKD